MMLHLTIESVGNKLRAELTAKQFDVRVIVVYVSDELGQLLNPLIVLRYHVSTDDVL